MRALTLAVAAVVLAGCGGDEEEKGPSDGQRVRSAVAAYDRALRDGDARKACELTYLDFPRGAGRDRLLTREETDECARDTGKQLGGRPASGYRVRSVRVQGNTATVRIAAPSEAYEQPPVDRLRLRRFGESWRIAFVPD